VRALGSPAAGNYGRFGKLSSLKDALTTPPKAHEVVHMLLEGHGAVARTARGVFPLADEPTADLLTQRLTLHEQTARMLRSLLEE
jgi:starvation-inducible DNA-binding protein